MGLPGCKTSMMISVAVLIQYTSVMDRQMDTGWCTMRSVVQ